MDTAWIQIFLLTLTECVAPAGKTVCQEQTFELQFVTQSDCEVALQQLITLKDASDSVIVDKNRSRCVPSARQHRVFSSLAGVAESSADKASWRAPDAVEEPPSESSRHLHKARLDALETCDESQGVAPCKIGDIIIEATTEGEPVEVWRRD